MTRHFALSGVALAVVMLATNPASAQLLTLDGNGVTVGGSGDGGSDASVDVNLDGNGNLLGLGNGSSNTANVNLDLNGNGILDSDEDAAINLFGPGQNGETQLSVGANGNDDDVLVTLFGSGDQSGDVASVDILPGGAGGAGGGSEATIDLFGPSDPTETGSIGGGGAGGGGAAGGGATNPGGQGVVPPTRVAAANTNVRTNAGACFSPDSGQIAHLLGRNSYGGSVTASWQGAGEVSIVPVNICPDARPRLAAAIDADANVTTMQSAVASTARINARLGTQYQADDVLAVDSSGGRLTVYVY